MQGHAREVLSRIMNLHLLILKYVFIGRIMARYTSQIVIRQNPKYRHHCLRGDVKIWTGRGVYYRVYWPDCGSACKMGAAIRADDVGFLALRIGYSFATVAVPFLYRSRRCY